MKLFLDANALFTAAHNPNGKAALVIELGAQGKWALATSSYALEEAFRNLERKFPQSRDDLHPLLPDVRLAESYFHLPYPTALAEKDRPIFQAAMACGATYLLTGDLKDFGPFINRREETHGILVTTVAAFLKSLSE